MLISQGHDPRRTAGKIDGLLELTFSCRVAHSVDRRHDLAHPISQPRSVADGNGTEVAHQLVVSWRRGTDNRCAAGDGKLSCDHPDRAGGTENEERLAAGEPELLEDAHCGFCRGGEGGRIAPTHVGRLPGPRRSERVFGVAAQIGQEARDFIAVLDPFDRRTDRVDDTCRLKAEHRVGGKAKHRLNVTAADLRIRGTHARALDSDTHLARTRLGHGDVLPDEDVRRSVFRQDNSFRHG